MTSRVRLAAFGLATLLSTAVIWSGCNESREVEEEAAAELQDLRSSLRLEIQSAEFPETGNPTVTFRVTDQNGDPVSDFVDQAWEGARPLGQGEQRTAPYIAPPRFVIAQLEESGDYRGIQARAVTGRQFRAEEGGEVIDPATPPAGGFTQTVADQPPTTDENAFRARFDVSRAAEGVYTYTLGPATVTDGIDRTRTFTAAMWATRNTPVEEGSSELRASPANATLNFVPAGGTAERDEVVVDQACNACHGVMSAHDNRTGVQLCITCHSPQTSDPESGNTVDFKVMIHKIHNGSGLPSVAEGQPYRIVGFASGVAADQPLPPSAVHDFSEVTFPRPVRNCTACHQGEDAANYNTRPSAVACGSCHDNVRFTAAEADGLPTCGEDGVGTQPCAHLALPAIDLSNCSGCHGPAVIDAQHLVPGLAEAANYRYEVVDVEVPEDRRPVITFRVVNPNNDTPYNLRTNDTWTQTANGNSRLFVNIAFPSVDYTNDVGGGEDAPHFGEPISIPIVDRPGINADLQDAENGAYRITSPIALPAGVTAFAVHIEGHPAVSPTRPTAGARIPVTNVVEFVGVNGPAQPRRDVVRVESCNACHGVLSAHGNNRNNSVQACAVCHNPSATDRGIRPEGTEGETQIDFKWMIHAIHAGGVRESTFQIFGFGGRPNEFPLPVPFDVGDCNMCHSGETWRVPLQDVVLGTTVDTGADPASAGDNVREPPTTSTCLSCHEGRQSESLGVSARDHALAYVRPDGTETCQQCHGTGGIADVARVHPIRARDENGNVIQ